jgi:hypothetical protein
MAYYMHLGFKPDSPAQNPERLVFEPKLMALLFTTFALCTALLFVPVPGFAAWFTPRILPP